MFKVKIFEALGNESFINNWLKENPPDLELKEIVDILSGQAGKE